MPKPSGRDDRLSRTERCFRRDDWIESSLDQSVAVGRGGNEAVFIDGDRLGWRVERVKEKIKIILRAWKTRENLRKTGENGWI